MMARNSAGILLYRIKNGKLQVMLVHPGGPFWAKKDKGVWSVPKGEFNPNESAREAACREFREETGNEVSGDFMDLSPVKLKSGKIIYAFALEHDLDTSSIVSNTFEMEWPPKSGKTQEFPEVDKGAWFEPDVAREKINPGQVPFIDELEKKLGTDHRSDF